MKKTLFICALLAFGAQVSAQGIFESNVSTANSIVRVWQDEEVLIYNQDGLTKGSFLLYDIGASSAKQIDLPNGILVKDFEILYGDVFFCGVMPNSITIGGNIGVVGNFNITNTFNGTGDINYAPLSWYFDYPNYNMIVESLNRLDLFIDSGRIVMAMTGNSYLYGDSTEKRTTVVSAYLVPSTTPPSIWRAYALMDKKGSAIYTDIAVLDDMVSVVGTSINGTGLLTKTFHKRSNLPYQPIIQYQADSIVFQNPRGKPLITHTHYNEAAITDLDLKAFTTLHLIDFSTGASVPSAPTRATPMPGYTYNSTWGMHEIRYNYATDNISILEYGILPGSSIFETLLWTFHHATGIITWAYVEPINTEKLVSMDVDVNSRPVSVGEDVLNNALDIRSHIFWTNAAPYLNPEPDNCNKQTQTSQWEEFPMIHQILVDEFPFQHLFVNETHTPQVKRIRIANKCE